MIFFTSSDSLIISSIKSYFPDSFASWFSKTPSNPIALAVSLIADFDLKVPKVQIEATRSTP